MELDVLLNGEVAGTLSYTASPHRYAFRYSPAWLSRKDRYALGPTLPLELAVVAHGAEAAVQEQHSAAVRQFFENLLPEGQALDDAASTHRLSKGNLMGLLAALGGETAGALQLRQPGTELAPVAEIRRAHRQRVLLHAPCPLGKAARGRGRPRAGARAGAGSEALRPGAQARVRGAPTHHRWLPGIGPVVGTQVREALRRRPRRA